MIFTLISLVEFDGVFRGLYFFSRGGVSEGPEMLWGKEITCQFLQQPPGGSSERSSAADQTNRCKRPLEPLGGFPSYKMRLKCLVSLEICGNKTSSNYFDTFIPAEFLFVII